MTAFTDEELKVSVRNIRNKKLVWKSFVSGIGENLSQELHRNNMRYEQVLHFADTVGVDAELLYPSVKKGKWGDFIAALVKHVPRQGDHKRYDM